jgi:hypothetical protein
MRGKKKKVVRKFEICVERGRVRRKKSTHICISNLVHKIGGVVCVRKTTSGAEDAKNGIGNGCSSSLSRISHPLH